MQAKDEQTVRGSKDNKAGFGWGPLHCVQQEERHLNHYAE